MLAPREFVEEMGFSTPPRPAQHGVAGSGRVTGTARREQHYDTEPWVEPQREPPEYYTMLSPPRRLGSGIKLLAVGAGTELLNEWDDDGLHDALVEHFDKHPDHELYRMQRGLFRTSMDPRVDCPACVQNKGTARR